MNTKYIIDTNVPTQAAKSLEGMSKLEAKCTKCCYDFIEAFILDPKSMIVLDDSMEILNEYSDNTLPQSVASVFLRWVCKYIKSMPPEDLIRISKSKDGSYDEFPKHDSLQNFDKSDRKFIALSNAHPEHPTIVQGTDYKWANFVEVFNQFGIQVHFLCEEYINSKKNERVKKRALR